MTDITEHKVMFQIDIDPYGHNEDETKETCINISCAAFDRLNRIMIKRRDSSDISFARCTTFDNGSNHLVLTINDEDGLFEIEDSKVWYMGESYS